MSETAVGGGGGGGERGGNAIPAIPSRGGKFGLGRDPLLLAHHPVLGA